jgi:hypothetical protein
MECRRIFIIGSSLLIALVLFTQVRVLLRKYRNVRPYEKDVNSKRKFRRSKIDWSTIVKPEFKF